MIKTILVDDDPLSLDAAAAALEKYPQVKITGKFTTSRELFAFLLQERADLIFLDIELENESGFQTAQKLRRDYPDILFVFLTGFSSYAIDGYDFQPLGFLTKPINPVKLDNLIEEAKRRVEKGVQYKKEAKIMLRMMNGHRVAEVGNILYFVRRNRKTFMGTKDGEERIANYSIHDLEGMLAPYGFFCCHQSYLVSLYAVRGLRDADRQLYEADLEGSPLKIPVSRYRYREMQEKLREIGLH